MIDGARCWGVEGGEVTATSTLGMGVKYSCVQTSGTVVLAGFRAHIYLGPRLDAARTMNVPLPAAYLDWETATRSHRTAVSSR